MSKDTRATLWSLTIWMPPYTEDSAKEMLERVAQQNPKWVIEGQLEKGEQSGRLHYQLMVKTPQVRHSALRKAFPSCHIEEARNRKALEQYVHKDETRVGEFKTIENRFPTWPVVRDMFIKWLVDARSEYDLTWSERRLDAWDEFISQSIKEGVECDLVGVNPQYRSCIIKYLPAYIHKYRQTSVDNTQTDSQQAFLPTTLNEV